MYIIIMGGGRIGNNLAKSLVNRGHEVTVLEMDKARATEISAELDALVVNEDGKSIRGLEEVNIFTADAFVSVTGDDGSNLTGCLLAKEYGVKITIARVADYQKSEIFRKLGVNVVVSPELAASQYIERFIMRPDVIDLAVIGGGPGGPPPHGDAGHLPPRPPSEPVASSRPATRVSSRTAPAPAWSWTRSWPRRRA